MHDKTLAVLVLSLACLTGSAAAQQLPRIDGTPQPAAVETSPSPPPPQDASALMPIFQFQHRRYAVGEPIFVRVGLKNTSSHRIDLYYDLPWHDCAMSVVGPDGRAVVPGLVDISAGPSSLRPYSIEPGATHIITWYQQEWYPLEHWSYNLSVPGRYRVVVRSRARGENTTNVDQEGSTTVTLTIVP